MKRFLLLLSFAICVSIGSAQNLSYTLSFEFNGNFCEVNSDQLASCVNQDSSVFSFGRFTFYRQNIFSQREVVRCGTWLYFDSNIELFIVGDYGQEGDSSGVWYYFTDGSISRIENFFGNASNVVMPKKDI